MFSFKNGLLTIGMRLWVPAFVERRLLRGREALSAAGFVVRGEKRWFGGVVSAHWQIDPEEKPPENNS